MRLTLAVALSLLLLACGSNNQQNAINLSGTWNAVLQTANGSTRFAFSSRLQEIGGSLLNGSNVTFNPSSSCFQSGLSESGLLQFSGSGYGYYTGGVTEVMSLTVKGSAPGGGTDTLNLQGSVNPDHMVSGTWTVTGVSSACSGSGAFTMTKVG